MPALDGSAKGRVVAGALGGLPLDHFTEAWRLLESGQTGWRRAPARTAAHADAAGGRERRRAAEDAPDEKRAEPSAAPFPVHVPSLDSAHDLHAR